MSISTNKFFAVWLYLLLQCATVFGEFVAPNCTRNQWSLATLNGSSYCFWVDHEFSRIIRQFSIFVNQKQTFSIRLASDQGLSIFDLIIIDIQKKYKYNENPSARKNRSGQKSIFRFYDHPIDWSGFWDKYAAHMLMNGWILEWFTHVTCCMWLFKSNHSHLWMALFVRWTRIFHAMYLMMNAHEWHDIYYTIFMHTLNDSWMFMSRIIAIILDHDHAWQS